MNMFFVEKFAKALSSLATKKLQAAQKRQTAASNKLKDAQRNLENTNTDLRFVQAGIMAQLTRMNQVGEEVTASMALNEAKNIKLKALIDTDFQD